MINYLVLAAVFFIIGFYVARKTGKNTHFENLEDDTLEIPSESLQANLSSDLDVELSDEENDRQANLLSKISMVCKMLESIADEAPNDEYSHDRIIDRVSKAEEILTEISDSFYHDAALHQIINILYKAKMFEKAKVHFANVSDDMIRSKILEDNPDLISA
jgi:hypothetical protein